jgi:hypothetical protein
VISSSKPTGWINQISWNCSEILKGNRMTQQDLLDLLQKFEDRQDALKRIDGAGLEI